MYRRMLRAVAFVHLKKSCIPCAYDDSLLLCMSGASVSNLECLLEQLWHGIDLSSLIFIHTPHPIAQKMVNIDSVFSAVDIL